jgi:hypothetical protein
MTVAARVDANILVYRSDNRFPRNKRLATEMLRRGLGEDPEDSLACGNSCPHESG